MFLSNEIWLYICIKVGRLSQLLYFYKGTNNNMKDINMGKTKGRVKNILFF